MDPKNVHIEFTAGAEHARLAAELHRHCFDPAWGEASFQSALTIPGTLAQFLSQEGSPVAFALYRHMQEEAEILTFCVLPEFRQSGYGHRLLRSGIDYFRQTKVRSIFLEVSAANASAIHLYKNAGFVQIGRRKNYYTGGGDLQDALILKLSCTEAISPKSSGKKG